MACVHGRTRSLRVFGWAGLVFDPMMVAVVLHMSLRHFEAESASKLRGFSRRRRLLGAVDELDAPFVAVDGATANEENFFSVAQVLAPPAVGTPRRRCERRAPRTVVQEGNRFL